MECIRISVGIYGCLIISIVEFLLSYMEIKIHKELNIYSYPHKKKIKSAERERKRERERERAHSLRFDQGNNDSES